MAVPPQPTASPTPAEVRLPRLFNSGYALDVFLCALVFNGDKGESMSHCAARRALEGAGWACLFCRLLDLIVERDHCAKTLAAGDTGRIAMVRAGIAILAALAVFFVALHVAFHGLARLI